MILVIRCYILPLFLIFICQNFRPVTSHRGSRRGGSYKRETIKGGPGKGEPSKAGPSKGDSSDEGPGPSKKQKTCDKAVCGECEKDIEYCVCWPVEGKILHRA